MCRPQIYQRESVPFTLIVLGFSGLFYQLSLRVRSLSIGATLIFKYIQCSLFSAASFLPVSSYLVKCCSSFHLNGTSSKKLSPIHSLFCRLTTLSPPALCCKSLQCMPCNIQLKSDIMFWEAGDMSVSPPHYRSQYDTWHTVGTWVCGIAEGCSCQ